MQNEMNQLFADGGVMQEGGTVDPVSGNDVPVGAMAEEVRDDIDAKLSEGEFVIPADVVRYIGLETLMKLRDKAKMGLKKMEEIGQMGNAEEVPDGEALHGEDTGMDDESFSSEIDSIMGEDTEQEYAAGGYVRKYAPGGYVVPENKDVYRDAPLKGFEMVPMTNDDGQTIYIPYINGVAQLKVPSGYRVKKSDDVAAPVTGNTGGAGSGGGNTDNSGGGDSGNDSAPAAPAGVGFTVGVDGVATPNTVSPTAVGLVTSTVMGPTIGVIGKNVAEALNSITTQAAQAFNTAVADNMAIDNSPTATAGPTGTGAAAAAAGATAASAAAAAGHSAEAQGAAAQAAADATIGGLTASQAAEQGNAAAVSVSVAEGNTAAAAATSDTAPDSGPVGNEGSATGNDAGVGDAPAGGGEAPSADSATSASADSSSSASDGTGSGGDGAGSSGGDGTGSGGDGPGSSFAKGGFVSKRKNKKTGKSTSFVTRQK